MIGFNVSVYSRHSDHFKLSYCGLASLRLRIPHLIFKPFLLTGTLTVFHPSHTHTMFGPNVKIALGKVKQIEVRVTIHSTMGNTSGFMPVGLGFSSRWRSSRASDKCFSSEVLRPRLRAVRNINSHSRSVYFASLRWNSLTVHFRPRQLCKRQSYQRNCTCNLHGRGKGGGIVELV